MACADSNSSSSSSVAQCELDGEAPCGAPSMSITAAATEAAAPAISAGITYAIAGPGAGKRGYVVFTPSTTGTHTLYFGNQAPVRVCDEEAICSSVVTSCGVLHMANQYAMNEGEAYVIELEPAAQPFRVHIVAPEEPPPPPPGGELALGAPMFYSTGPDSNPAYLTLADLNGDATLDIIASTLDDAGGFTWLDILQGNANGSFTAVNRVETSAPGQTRVHDWSGDGIADIIGVAWDGQGPLPHHYFRGTGDFEYAPREQWLAGRSLSLRLVAADFDEDGTPDLLSPFMQADEAPDVSGFVIVGMPGFATLQNENVFGTETIDAVAGDFNGDGHQDVLVGDGNAPRVGLFLGDGTGTVAFASEINLPQSTGVVDLVALDLNGDSRTDFVAVNRFGVNGTVGIATATGFSLQLLPDVGRGYATAGDFDGDGRTDLIVRSDQQNVLNFYRATDDGFVLADSFGTGATDLAAADVNGDGRLDLVTNAGGGILVYLGTP